jgi:hypothetical protein
VRHLGFGRCDDNDAPDVNVVFDDLVEHLDNGVVEYHDDATDHPYDIYDIYDVHSRRMDRDRAAVAADHGRRFLLGSRSVQGGRLGRRRGTRVLRPAGCRVGADAHERDGLSAAGGSHHSSHGDRRGRRRDRAAL